ncbi:hypothetical protein AKJ09_02020 [Labilithrix luteola]|uniref:DUF2846 domain-containing protein n=1 Tax=Labilithrix luteola TaxID=1391654 RepID=A0A0K1PPQ0_9BACT|nr:hypothetical protein [Labilithrix luteola]AKU95356.1 hypothetical protein AKJ09_02020 [Labilithrix luteola]
MTLLLALVLLLTGSGCSATSKYMTPSPAGPASLAAAGDMATVVFIRPSGFAGSQRATVLDGQGRFLGDSLPESYFAVKVPPGEHVFISWAENTGALRATLAAGKVYFVEVSPKMGAFSARVHLLAITPRASSWKKLDEWIAESKAYVPDEVHGQAYLASRKNDVAERIRRANEALNKDYSRDELDERTLLPTDSR